MKKIMALFSLTPTRQAMAVALTCLASLTAHADGGMSLQGTRLIYPAGEKQVTIATNNSSTTDSFLVQSWVSNADRQKSPDFVVTPPLFVSGPGNQNTLRIMYIGGELPRDRESLYYLSVKGIPSMNKPQSGAGSQLSVAIANRIKLFVRPSGLTPAVNDAPAKLQFHRVGATLNITNPTPYYLTLTDLKSGEQPLKDVMVAPRGNASQALPAGVGNTVTFHTLNDFGALTPSLTRPLN